MASRTRFLAPAVATALVATLPAAARAQETARAPETPRHGPIDPDTLRWEAGMAYRGAWIESPGYAPFSENDYFPQFSLDASRMLWRGGRLGVGAGVAWDYATAGAWARGATTELVVHRLSGQLLARYRIVKWLDAFARIAPGALYEKATVAEPSSPARLVKDGWVPSGDASAGVAWSFADSWVGSFPFAFWVTGEGGYGFGGKMTLAMSPDLPSSDPRQTSATNLGTLSMSGAFMRIGLATTF